MKKSYWLYGLAMGVLLILLQIIEYKTMVYEIAFETYGLSIGAVFLLFGIWLGGQIMTKKRRQVNMALNMESNLSERELEVLGLMADGLSNQEIAEAIFVSLNTVKTHISNIYLKMHVKRRTQAIQKARELKMIVSVELSD